MGTNERNIKIPRYLNLHFFSFRKFLCFQFVKQFQFFWNFSKNKYVRIKHNTLRLLSLSKFVIKNKKNPTFVSCLVQWDIQRKNVVIPSIVRNFPRWTQDSIFNAKLETPCRIQFSFPSISSFHLVQEMKEKF
jgi:hypothetical protein